MNISQIMQLNAMSISTESSDVNIKKTTNNNVTVDSQQKNKEYTREELDESLKKMDSFLKHDGAHTEYAVHKDFGTIIIKVVDDKTRQVLFETPPEKILDMVATICRNNGLIDKKA